VYGSFAVLSLLAYATRQFANKSDDKKVSVSNINFKRYLVYFYFYYSTVYCTLVL
jgi:peroxiredoxin